MSDYDKRQERFDWHDRQRLHITLPNAVVHLEDSFDQSLVQLTLACFRYRAIIKAHRTKIEDKLLHGGLEGLRVDLEDLGIVFLHELCLELEALNWSREGRYTIFSKRRISCYAQVCRLEADPIIHLQIEVVRVSINAFICRQAEYSGGQLWATLTLFLQTELQICECFEHALVSLVEERPQNV